jgi:uncharacterized protein (DUF3820 family)
MAVIDDPVIDRPKGTGPSGIDLDKITAKPGAKYTISTTGDDAVIHFGKHAGKTLTLLALGADRSYLDWMMAEDFPEELKDVIKYVLKKTKAAK